RLVAALWRLADWRRLLRLDDVLVLRLHRAPRPERSASSVSDSVNDRAHRVCRRDCAPQRVTLVAEDDGEDRKWNLHEADDDGIELEREARRADAGECISENDRGAVRDVARADGVEVLAADGDDARFVREKP